jgi:HK97 gp10 family phage protein
MTPIFKMIGAKEVVRAINKATKDIENKAWLVIVDGALAIHKTAVDSIKQQKGSEMVTRYNPKRTRKVSDEGSPPNSDTGVLIASIAVRQFKSENRIEVGSYGIRYGAWLEFGTLTMGERPWLRPALRANTPKINQAMKEAAKGFGK